MKTIERKVAKNVFSGKMVMGVDRSFVSKDLITLGLNVQIINDEETNFAITNIKGTTIIGNLTPGFIPIGVRAYGGIAYFTSYNPTTGQGEIGTFPSPNYGVDDTIIQSYSPLKNYLPDDFIGTPVLSDYGNFTTPLLGFSLDKPLEIEIQPDYDNTVNIIISDRGYIINSGFSVLPDNKFVRIDRIGKDSNYYSQVNFVNTIPLIETSTKLLKINFDNVKAGGILKAGNYRYYFYYSTQDFNNTNIIGESGNVSVFIGESPQNIRGGKPNEPTNKLVVFNISNLDTVFAYLKVYFTYSAGDNVSVTESFSIDNNYVINGDSLVFTHTGFESVSRINNDVLSNEYLSISGYKTQTQIQNRLFIANVYQRNRNNVTLQTFAQKITVGHVVKEIGIRATENVGQLDDLYTVITDAVVGDGYDGGYYNPKNIHSYLGYWGAESYAFMAHFIMLDGSVSAGFPVRGIDNVDNTASYSTLPLESEEYFNETTGDNYRGVYRFPRRKLAGTKPLIENGKIKVFGVTFLIPDLTTDVSGVKITDITKGIFFSRAERVKDAYAQGYNIPTIITEIIEYPNDSSGDHSLNKNTVSADSPQSDEKVIPAVRGILEGVYVKDVDDNEFTPTIAPVAIRKYFVSNTRLAFYSNDILNKELVAQVSGRDTKLEFIAEVTVKPTLSSKALDDAAWISVYKTVDIINITQASVPIRTEYVSGHTNIITNFGRFSSKAVLQVTPDTGPTLLLIRMPLTYNSYYGLTIKEGVYGMDTYATSTSVNTSRDGEFYEYRTHPLVNVPVGMLANIYPVQGPRTIAINKQVHQVGNYRGTPISERLYWNTSFEGSNGSNNLEDKLVDKVNDRRFVCFGGDCFINVGFQRIFHNDKTIALNGELEGLANIGYTLSIVNESNINVAFRDNEVTNVVEAEHSFIPYYASNQNTGDIYGKGNKYREYRLPESTYLSAGFSKLKTDIQQFAYDSSIPFQQTVFDTTVYYSELHVNNAFNNGYRKFFPANKKTYGKNLGSITRIFGLNGLLVLLQERGTSIIPINQRIQTGSDAGGAIFVESLGVLSEANIISELYGLQYQFAAVASDNFVYFFDAINKTLCQLVITKEGGAINVMSLISLSSHLNKYTKTYAGKKEKVNTVDIRAHFDSDTKDIYFTFYDTTNTYNSFTVKYSETNKAFVSFYNFLPILYFNLGEKMHSFSLLNNDINLHNSNVLRNTFYGTEYMSVIEFIVNEDMDFEKEFQNLVLVTNNVLPKRIKYSIQGGNTLQVVKYDPDKIYLSNAFYVREGVKIVIPLMETITNQSETEYLAAELTNTMSILLKDSRIRSKNLVVRLEYETNKLLNLKSVLTVYDVS